MEEAAPSALCPGWGIAAGAPGPPPSIADAPRTAFQKPGLPDSNRAQRVTLPSQMRTRPGRPGPGSPGMQETGVGASSQPPGPSAGVPPPQMTPLRPQQGLSPARAQNGLECGTAPPSQGSSAGPRGEGPGLSVGKAGATRGQGRWTADTARPARRADTNAAHPTGAQPGRPSHADTKQGRALGACELHGDRSPGRTEPLPLAGAAGPRLHRRRAERPKGAARGWETLFPRQPHRKRPARPQSWIHVHAKLLAKADREAHSRF